MRLKLVIGVILGAVSPASAERSIVAEVAPHAGFDATELTAALRVRLAPEGAPVTVRVLATPTGVRVEVRSVDRAIVRDGARELTLDGLTGPAAARMVALSANDLILEDLALLPAEPGAPAAARGTTLAVLGAAAAWDGVLGGATVDMMLPRDRWLAAIEVGAAMLAGGPIALDAGLLRLSAGVQTGWVELRAGVTVAPLIVNSHAGDRTVLVGGGASARGRVPLGAGLSAVFAAGADVFATRTHYLLDGMPALTTPRVAPWFAAGLEVTP